ncbi:outer-membrane lipoprotein LolB [Thalassotalea profundi]|uniref:Outer-membrane lipoprotein LolB n=2 Tax=Thalassotalea profundi TaxID=2036687 RepID=A0ABQ3II10_9GAMM|nr:outer-membrane lipoprotein LolB [Thalassotalea profundi]
MPKLNQQSLPTNYSLENRVDYLTTINNWQINGKIAFLDDKERKSATLFWQNNPNKNTEQLSLTTYLGINVLEVNLAEGIYTIEVDGNSYQNSNIDHILMSLTGYQLPSQALKSWIKAIPFSVNDKITYHSKTQLPESIIGSYNNQTWDILYKEYINVNNIPLPKQLTIKQDQLTIKIVINQWMF